MKLWQEFKDFAFKGSLIDLAIGFVIGSAFSGVVKSLVDNIVMPIVSYIAPGKDSYTSWHIGRITFGVFLGDLLNFVIIAFALFLIVVQVLGMIKKVATKPAAPGEPTTKECPMCLSVIPIKARKCAHCTADLEPALAR